MIRLLVNIALIAASLYLLADLADHFSAVVDSRRAQIEQAAQ